MKKLTVLAIIAFYTINAFAQSNVNGNYTFYTDGGDTLKFSIKKSKLYLIEGVMLNYQPSRNNFYLKKIINQEVYKNEEYWALYKEEYIVSPLYVANQLESVSLTVKTYFGSNRLINSYTKKFNRVAKNTGKFIFKYKLVSEYKNFKKYCGGDFDRELMPNVTVTDEEEDVYIKPDEEFELILNNDNTLTIDPGSFSYLINAKKGNAFSGKGEFGSCIHDYSYTNIKKTGERTIDFFQYSASDGGCSISCGKYELISKRKIKPILFNSVLTGKIPIDAGYTAEEEN